MKKIFLALIALFLLPVYAFCQTAADTMPVNRATALTLPQAVELALKNNAQMKISREQVSEAKGLELQSLSSLLPHLSASTYQQRTWLINMASLGMPQLGGIGPFNSFDARFSFTQKIFDMADASRAAAGQTGVFIANLKQDFTRQRVILTATLSYLGLLRDYHDLKSAYANRRLSLQILKKAEHQQAVGLASGMDVARSRTKTAEEDLRLSEAKLNYHQTLLEFQRVTGLPFGSRVRLLERLAFFEDIFSTDAAPEIAGAFKKRLETRIAAENQHLREKLLNAAQFDLLPKVQISADYGWNGVTPDKPLMNTGQGIIGANMPLFEGGLTQGRIREAASKLEQSRFEKEDIGRQVEEDVRQAWRRAKTGSERVATAKIVLQLAKKELAMAQHRFESGVADNIDVLIAQTSFENARDGYIASLTLYHMSRVNLYSAMGRIENFRLAFIEKKDK